MANDNNKTSNMEEQIEKSDLWELNRVLEEKNRTIYELKDQIRALENTITSDFRAWKLEQYLPIDGIRKDLPIPRLEMIHRKLDPPLAGSEWVYGIVRLAHEGLREEWDSTKCNFTPLSRTTSTSEQLSFDNKNIDMPRRDFDHLLEDMNALGLPAFITCPELGLVQSAVERREVMLRFRESL